MKNIIILICICLGFLSSKSQTTNYISASDGGFENATTTFAGNGWTVVNGANATTDYNRWIIGTNAKNSGTYGAYVASSGYTTAATNTYTASSSDVCHIYRDFNFTAGENKITLTFKWKSRGHTDISDYLNVYIAPTTVTPTEDALVDASYKIGGPYYNVTTWQTTTITIDQSWVGTSGRIIFSWKNNTTNTTNPPAAIDDISLTSETAVMTYTSSTTVQASTDTICSCHLNQKIIQVPIVTGTVSSPAINATSFTFNTNGSTNAANDIKNAKLFYTGTSSTFGTSTQLGLATTSPIGSFTTNGFTQSLALGTNYFWLAYDLSSSATANNSVDAECSSLIVGGISYNPSTTAPAGSRTISPNCPPPNDHCYNAIPLTQGVTVSTSNDNADISTGSGPFPEDPYNSSSEFTCNSSADNYTYFTFTTNAAGDYSINIDKPTSCRINEGLQAAVFLPGSACPGTGSWGSAIACSGQILSSSCAINLPSLLASTTYYLIVDGWAGDECGFGVTLNDYLLPIQLIDFNAKCNNKNVLIGWSTASEINNAFFTVEKSADLNHWTIVTKVNGAGNSNSISNYSFIDLNITEQTTYYRLTQTDFDGKFEIFNPVSVYCTDNSDTLTAVFYPESDEIIISTQSPDSDTGQVQVVSNFGQIIFSEKYIILSGYNSTRIKIPSFTPGYYIVNVWTQKRNYKPVKLFLTK